MRYLQFNSARRIQGLYEECPQKLWIQAKRNNRKVNVKFICWKKKHFGKIVTCCDKQPWNIKFRETLKNTLWSDFEPSKHLLLMQINPWRIWQSAAPLVRRRLPAPLRVRSGTTRHRGDGSESEVRKHPTDVDHSPYVSLLSDADKSHPAGALK